MGVPTKRALSDDAVIEIAVEIASGAVTISTLAQRHGVSRTTISDALHGRGAYAVTARLLPVERLAPMLRYRTAARGNKLLPHEAERVRVRFSKGDTYRELARAYGISKQQVSRMVRGLSYREAGGPVYNPKRR